MIVLIRAIRMRRESIGAGVGWDCGKLAYSCSTSPSDDVIGSVGTGSVTGIGAVGATSVDSMSAAVASTLGIAEAPIGGWHGERHGGWAPPIVKTVFDTCNGTSGHPDPEPYTPMQNKDKLYRVRTCS